VLRHEETGKGKHEGTMGTKRGWVRASLTWRRRGAEGYEVLSTEYSGRRATAGKWTMKCARPMRLTEAASSSATTTQPQHVADCEAEHGGDSQGQVLSGARAPLEGSVAFRFTDGDHFVAQEAEASLDQQAAIRLWYEAGKVIWRAKPVARPVLAVAGA
jgi:hypothetical protein